MFVIIPGYFEPPARIFRATVPEKREPRIPVFERITYISFANSISYKNRHGLLPSVKLSYHTKPTEEAIAMSDNIIQLNEDLIKNNLKVFLSKPLYQRIIDYSLFISLSTDKIFTLFSKIWCAAASRKPLMLC